MHASMIANAYVGIALLVAVYIAVVPAEVTRPDAESGAPVRVEGVERAAVIAAIIVFWPVLWPMLLRGRER